MGQSNDRMPVAAEKGVEGGTASQLIFLSLGEEAKEEGLDLMKGYPCRQSKDFNSEQKKREFSASRSIQGLKIKIKFRKRETKKTINYQSFRKGTLLVEASNQSQHFSSILTLVRVPKL